MTARATFRRVAAQAVKVAAVGVDVVRRPPAGVVILLYHRVGATTPSAVDQPVELFDEQMAEIAARALTLDAALAELNGPATADRRGSRVVVSFDDGTADFVERALPVLVRHRVPAVLYVATEFVDRQRPFPHDAAPLSWNALSDALTTGLVTVGSHTHTHTLLDRVDAATAADELDRSIDLIGEHLGVPAAHFAYPKAQPPNDAAEAEVRKRFESAALAGTTSNPAGATDPYRLARSPIQVADGMRWFRHKAAGGMAVEDTLRRAANRSRYSHAVT